MHILKLIALSLGILFLAACSSNKYAVTIDSNPKGAEVFCNGQSYGYTPVTRYFELDAATKESGYLRTCQWWLKWVSGATAKVNNVYDLNKFPNGVIWTTPRPNSPNAHIDHQFSQQLQQNKINQQMLDTQREMQRQQQQQINEQNRPKTCVKTYNVVNCY